MQEKPPFSSYFDIFFFLTYGRGTPPPIPTPAYFDFALRHAIDCYPTDSSDLLNITLVNVYANLLVFTHIDGTS